MSESNQIVLLSSQGEELGVIEYGDEEFNRIRTAALIHNQLNPLDDISEEDEAKAIEVYVNYALKLMIGEPNGEGSDQA